MSYVTIEILTPEKARTLRLEAQLVLRSVSRRKTCECERPWRGDYGNCARCGKWIQTPRLVRALRRYIEGMEDVEKASSEPLADVSMAALSDELMGVRTRRRGRLAA